MLSLRGVNSRRKGIEMKHLTDIGGRCPHCRQEENWMITHREQFRDDPDSYHVVVECQTVTDGEMCGTEKDKYIKEERHYSHWESHLQYF